MRNSETVEARDQSASRRMEAPLSLARAPEPEAEDMSRSVTPSPVSAGQARLVLRGDILFSSPLGDR